MKSVLLLFVVILYYATTCSTLSDSFAGCLKVTAYPLPLSKLNGTRYIADIAKRNHAIKENLSCGYATYSIENDGATGKEIRSVFDKNQNNRTFSTYFVKQVMPGINEKTTMHTNIISTATVVAYEKGIFDINYICERQNGVDITDRFSLATVSKEFAEEDILKAYEYIGGIPKEFTHCRMSQKNCDYSM